MTDHRLRLGTDGDLWLVADDGPDCHARCLGEPEERLYDVLPVALWEELGRLIVSLRGGRVPEGAVPCEGDCADCLRGEPCDERIITH